MATKDPKTAGHFEHLHGFDVNAVKATFKKAWKAFNANDKNSLGTCLNNDVILCEVRDQAPIAKGKAAVLAILTNSLNDHPPGLKGATFTPNNDEKDTPTKVHGTAYWHDNDGSQDDPAIAYDFDFDDASLILKMYAEHS